MDVPPPALKPPVSNNNLPSSSPTSTTTSIATSAINQHQQQPNPAWPHPVPASYSSMVLPNTAPLENNFHIPLPPSPPDGLKSFHADSAYLAAAAKDFSSRAADLEYSSISNLLGGIGGDLSDIFESSAQFDPSNTNNNTNTNNNNSINAYTPAASTATASVDTPPNSEYSPASAYSTSSSTVTNATNTQLSKSTIDSSPHPRAYAPQPQPQAPTLGSFPTLHQQQHQQPLSQQQQQQQHAPIGRPIPLQQQPSTAVHATGLFTPAVYDTPEDVYTKVTRPYPYTKGYHALIAYLRQRFAKPQLMVLAKSMAAYRPSFIATTKTLQEDDLIFMEKCFQRTLLEFQKFIMSSGTPTVVWRRTGQIAAAGREFCILTGWAHTDLVRCPGPDQQQQLLQQNGTETKNQEPRFIMELMDDASVTRYFEVFTTLAFGDSRGVIMTECTLLRPDGQKVRTACTWTVKRDVFDIPMMIVGNFLPILE